MLYEGKWDGFRAIVFRDGEEVEIGSRTGKPLTRYFPELVEAARAGLPPRCVIDGEIVIATAGRLDFEALLERIHPADSRVRLLAQRTPASFIAFDLLALGDASLMADPLTWRRQALVDALGSAPPPIHIAPATTDIELAQEWFERFEGAGLDGVIAKRPDLGYRPDERVMIKVKHERTADCVLAGYRLHKSGPVVGSLLLGLYDAGGRLQHVGVCASFPMARRAALVEELEPLRMPGAQSRWSAGKDLSWVPLRPERVVEVAYDHMQGTRFRHTAQFRRWRDDRDPAGCTYAQLEEPVGYDLAGIFPQSS
jgi:ATP-dependent DNA ligase